MTNKLNQRIVGLEIPERMRKLSISQEGYPVPWFVPWINGQPEFRGMDGEKFGIAIRLKRCWLCGQQLGVYKIFVIGPMCAVNRVTAEPPCHLKCAEYAVKACPFLTQPRMRRNEKDLPEERHVAGLMIKRNPGVICLWATQSYKIFNAHSGGKGVLFEIGKPEKVEFYTEGRKATYEEIVQSIDTGLPLLLREAEQDADPQGAIAALHKQVEVAMKLLPSQ